jgi:hypothetical protein
MFREKIDKQKRLSAMKVTLSFAPYAEANFPQQNQKSGGETIQDHRARQGVAVAIRAAPFAFVKERKAQTSVEQNGERAPNGHRAHQGESAFRLRSTSRSNETVEEAALLRAEFVSS